MNPRTLLFRADANIDIGTGHVMRCLALAQAWQDDGGRAVFAMADSTPALREKLTLQACDVLVLTEPPGSAADARATADIAHEREAEWVVVDGYHFGAEYQRILKSSKVKILFLDDYGHADEYCADLVLNQNISAQESLYGAREDSVRLLLGTRYCLLRREFSQATAAKREIGPKARRVLVTMGGSDPANYTAVALEAIAALPHSDLEVAAIIGGSSPHFETLQAIAVQLQKEGRMNVVIHRDATNMAELMATADVAVSAAGSTCWELCLMGLPALLIDVAANQTALAQELDQRGCAIHLGSGQTVPAAKISERLRQLLDSRELRASLSARAQKLVDGQGARRVLSILSGQEGIHLRHAREQDGQLLWKWANDPDVRGASFSPDPIPWATHEAWFQRKLQETSCLILIAEDDERNAFGQIRFDSIPARDKAGEDVEVDVSIAKDSRGKGLGARVIDAGVKTLLRSKKNVRVHAFVKPENVASAGAFESARFRNIGMVEVRGSTAAHFIREEN